MAQVEFKGRFLMKRQDPQGEAEMIKGGVAATLGVEEGFLRLQASQLYLTKIEPHFLGIEGELERFGVGGYGGLNKLEKPGVWKRELKLGDFLQRHLAGNRELPLPRLRAFRGLFR